MCALDEQWSEVKWSTIYIATHTEIKNFFFYLNEIYVNGSHWWRWKFSWVFGATGMWQLRFEVFLSSINSGTHVTFSLASPFDSLNLKILSMNMTFPNLLRTKENCEKSLDHKWAHRSLGHVRKKQQQNYTV